MFIIILYFIIIYVYVSVTFILQIVQFILQQTHKNKVCSQDCLPATHELISAYTALI